MGNSLSVSHASATLGSCDVIFRRGAEKLHLSEEPFKLKKDAWRCDYGSYVFIASVAHGAERGNGTTAVSRALPKTNHTGGDNSTWINNTVVYKEVKHRRQQTDINTIKTHF